MSREQQAGGARDAVLGSIRKSLRVSGSEAERAEAVEARLSNTPKGVIPARGRLEPRARTALFCKMAEKVSASIRHVRKRDSIPRAVTEYLRAQNLPAALRMGQDARLTRLPWAALQTLEVRTGPSDGDDLVCISHALGAVAESGTLVLNSGPENPTTLNLLPEHHIVVLNAKDIAGDLEAVYARLRRRFGRGEMPRTVNLVTGPSRSADVEQTLVLGAHGPRALHIIVVDE